jgi:hypothetical protein
MARLYSSSKYVVGANDLSLPRIIILYLPAHIVDASWERGHLAEAHEHAGSRTLRKSGAKTGMTIQRLAGEKWLRRDLKKERIRTVQQSI